MAESTGFADKNGRAIYLGDVVRTNIKPPFGDMHGGWAEYEITKACGGYVLSYVRSEKGCVLPFGYTSCFMNDYDSVELPDLKILLWSEKPVTHPSLEKVHDDMTPAERRELFTAKRKRRK